MHGIPDIGPLVVMIFVSLAMIAKFYWTWRNHSWLAFADGMARMGLAAFYLATYLALLGGNVSGSDDWRALARLGILAVFMIEAIPWIIGLFKKGKRL
jgi:hypothetical protein